MNEWKSTFPVPLSFLSNGHKQQEQLECLHSEDTSLCPMITSTIDSYWIPSQNMTKSNLQIKKKIAKSSNFWILKKKKTLYAIHLLKLLDKMCIYEIKLIRRVLWKIEGSQDSVTDGQMVGRTDEETDKVRPAYPPSTSLSEGYNNHDDVISWTCFLYYRPFVKGINQSLVDSPQKGPTMQSLMTSLLKD